MRVALPAAKLQKRASKDEWQELQAANYLIINSMEIRQVTPAWAILVPSVYLFSSFQGK
jgi:hypothetical protein